MRLLSHRKSLDMANAFDSSFVPELFRSLQTACRSIVRLLVHKSIRVLAVLFALASASQPLEAHNASIAACKKLADNEWGNKKEEEVWDKICEAKCFDLKADKDCQDKVDNSGSDDNDSGSDDNDGRVPIQADFLHDILFQKCYRDVIGPRGIHIKNAKFVGELDLSWGKIPWPLRLESCSFESLTMRRFVAEREIVLTNSKIPDGLNIQSASIQRDLILKGLTVEKGRVNLTAARIGGNLSMAGAKFQDLDIQSGSIQRDLILKDLTVEKGRVNLTAARIGGNLSMADAKFHDLDLGFASIGARVDGNAFANGFRQPITGSLIQNHIEHMLTSLEMHTQFGMTANGNPLTAKGDLIMSGASIAGEANLSGTQVNGRLHLWDTGNEKKVFLHGLTYDEITVPQNNGKSTEKALKDWLGMDKSRSVQPYMYLASRLHAKNNFYISEQVLLAGQELLKKQETSTGKEFFESVTERPESPFSKRVSLISGFVYYEFLDGLLFKIIIYVKQIYQSPVDMFWMLIFLISVIFSIIIIKRQKQAREKSRKEGRMRGLLRSFLQKIKSFWEPIKSFLELIPWKVLLSLPWKNWKKDSGIGPLHWFLLVIGKVLFALILVRFILPIGIDIVSIIF